MYIFVIVVIYKLIATIFIFRKLKKKKLMLNATNNFPFTYICKSLHCQ